MVAHFDNLRGRDDVEAVVGASFGGNQFANALLVAEKHDAAVRTDCVESHHGSLDCGFGGEIAAHCVQTYLNHGFDKVFNKKALSK